MAYKLGFHFTASALDSDLHISCTAAKSKGGRGHRVEGFVYEDILVPYPSKPYVRCRDL